jgi:hypothetical protein
MTPNSFLNCINYNGFFTGITGSIVGIYDLGSGVSGVFYNLLYPSGLSFSGNQIYGPTYPLIAVGNNITGYQFSGVNAYRVGYTFSGDFGLILDIEYSGCVRNSSGRAFTLVSTADSPTGLSGSFLIGINEANRLFFETSGFSRTLSSYELRDKNIIYVGLGNQKSIEFGVFDYLNQLVVSETFSLNLNQNLINKIYLGSYLSYSGLNYTGFSGKINNVILSDKTLDISGISTCSNCLFVTGQTTGAPLVSTLLIPTVTGYITSGVSGQVITGYVPFTGVITKSDNTTVNVVFPSGLTGLVRIEDLTTILTGSTQVTFTGSTPKIFLTDTNKVNSFVSYDIQFDFTLGSGDYVEVQTYPIFVPFINIPVYNEDFPSANSGYIQIIGNGLDETANVDYFVVRNKISGFFDDDLLAYDLMSTAPIVYPFSGFWARDKIQMSGGNTYPRSPQFAEDFGTIVFSGITGVPITWDTEIYLNGQKLRSGFHYALKDDGPSGFNFFGVNGVVDVEMYPDTLPALIINPLYSPTGGLPTGIDSVEDSELTIFTRYGKFNNFIFDLSGSTTTLTGLSGFSERVWVNGIRQRLGSDYVKNFKCSVASGIVAPPSVSFNFYNNENNYFNIG